VDKGKINIKGKLYPSKDAYSIQNKPLHSLFLLQGQLIKISKIDSTQHVIGSIYCQLENLSHEKMIRM